MMEADLGYVLRESSLRIDDTSLSPESQTPRVNTTLSVLFQDDQRVGGAPRRTAPVRAREHLRLRYLVETEGEGYRAGSRNGALVASRTMEKHHRAVGTFCHTPPS